MPGRTAGLRGEVATRKRGQRPGPSHRRDESGAARAAAYTTRAARPPRRSAPRSSTHRPATPPRSRPGHRPMPVGSMATTAPPNTDPVASARPARSMHGPIDQAARSPARASAMPSEHQPRPPPVPSPPHPARPPLQPPNERLAQPPPRPGVVGQRRVGSTAARHNPSRRHRPASPRTVVQPAIRVSAPHFQRPRLRRVEARQHASRHRPARPARGRGCVSIVCGMPTGTPESRSTRRSASPAASSFGGVS